MEISITVIPTFVQRLKFLVFGRMYITGTLTNKIKEPSLKIGF